MLPCPPPGCGVRGAAVGVESGCKVTGPVSDELSGTAWNAPQQEAEPLDAVGVVAGSIGEAGGGSSGLAWYPDLEEGAEVAD